MYLLGVLVSYVVYVLLYYLIQKNGKYVPEDGEVIFTAFIIMLWGLTSWYGMVLVLIFYIIAKALFIINEKFTEKE